MQCVYCAISEKGYIYSCIENCLSSNNEIYTLSSTVFVRTYIIGVLGIMYIIMLCMWDIAN